MEEFLDTFLSPEERVFKVWYCNKKIDLERADEGTTDSSRFISDQTFKYIKCCCDGLILYLLMLKKEFHSSAIVTYFLGETTFKSLKEKQHLIYFTVLHNQIIYLFGHSSVDHGLSGAYRAPIGRLLGAYRAPIRCLSGAYRAPCHGQYYGTLCLTSLIGAR